MVGQRPANKWSLEMSAGIYKITFTLNYLLGILISSWIHSKALNLESR